MSEFDVIVIGSGITGLTATKRLLEAKPTLKIANIEAETFGGLVLNVNELDGKISGSGIQLASDLMVEIADLGATTLSENVTALTNAGNRGWKVSTSEGEYPTKAVIIASGAKLKRLGIPGEDQFEYQGVSHCADCDGPLYAGKDVVVAGGGDSALQEAVTLSQFCRTVIILNRSTSFTAKDHLIESIAGHANIQVKHQAEAVAIEGADSVSKVIYRDLARGQTGEIPCSGFFGYIGLQPSSGFAKDVLEMDAHGAIKTTDTLRGAPHLYAAGAVRSGYGGMIEHAIAEGRRAANEVLKLLG